MRVPREGPQCSTTPTARALRAYGAFVRVEVPKQRAANPALSPQDVLRLAQKNWETSPLNPAHAGDAATSEALEAALRRHRSPSAAAQAKERDLKNDCDDPGSVPTGPQVATGAPAATTVRPLALSQIGGRTRTRRVGARCAASLVGVAAALLGGDAAAPTQHCLPCHARLWWHCGRTQHRLPCHARLHHPCRQRCGLNPALPPLPRPPALPCHSCRSCHLWRALS